MSTSDATDMQRAWQDSAPYWERHRSLIEQMFAPLTSALIEEARIGAGAKVLDVAGGTGEPSLTIARVVGADGFVMYTDLVAGMLEAAKAEAEKRGLGNMAFQQCPAESLPFADDSFDVAVSRLGVMFFPDPVAGVREMMRVVKSGGYVSLVVWGAPNVNPFFHVITKVMERYIESPAEDPDAPGAFRFAPPGKLTAVLEEAGITETNQRLVKFNVAGPVSLDQFWTLRVQLSDSLREKVATLTAAQLTAARRDLEVAAREYFSEGAMSFPAQALAVSGRKP
jgi:ubiquinone/menaquinone biosynthesis C-methylase UbiE